MNRFPRHERYPREEDGAIQWRKLLPVFCREHPEAQKDVDRSPKERKRQEKNSAEMDG